MKSSAPCAFLQIVQCEALISTSACISICDHLSPSPFAHRPAPNQLDIAFARSCTLPASTRNQRQLHTDSASQVTPKTVPQNPMKRTNKTGMALGSTIRRGSNSEVRLSSMSAVMFPSSCRGGTTQSRANLNRLGNNLKEELIQSSL